MVDPRNVLSLVLRRIYLTMFLLIVLLPSASYSEPPRFESRPLAIEAQIGVGTPVGNFGAKLTYAIVPFFGVQFGGGWSTSGVQAASLVRLQTQIEEVYVSIGPGLSVGPYSWAEITFGDGEAAVKKSDLAVWFNAQGSVGGQFQNGFRTGLEVGYSWMLNPEQFICTGNIDHCENDHGGDGTSLFNIGISIGYAFRL